MRTLATVGVAVAVAAALCGCASRPMPAPGHEKDLARRAGQPLRDLSLMREQAPTVLQRAAAAPYDLRTLADCSAASAELAALDAALGPDLTPPTDTHDLDVNGLAADVLGGAVGLPYRGVVRRVTGAEARDRALQAAVLAGMVRRGYIKGRLSIMACPGEPARS